MDSDTSCIIDAKISYIITDDSDPVPSRPLYMKSSFQITVLLLWLTGMSLGILYDIGMFEVGVETEAEIIEFKTLCKRYRTMVNACTEIPSAMITQNGCPYYYESNGDICGTSITKNSCTVNSKCSPVSNSAEFNALDAMCKGYTTMVSFCSDISEEDIAQNSCLIYYQTDGGVCISDGDSCKANYKRCDIPI